MQSAGIMAMVKGGRSGAPALFAAEAAMTRCFAILLLAAATVLGGCVSTRAVSSWQLPLDAPRPQFRQLYVIALTPLDAVAVQLEAELVSRLEGEGLRATAGRRHFTEKELRDPATRARIAEQVRAAGADGVLLVTYLNSAEKKYYVPPSTTYQPALLPAPPLHGGYPAWIGYHYDVVHQPGYYATSTEYYVRTSLYQVGREEPVWQAQSATVDPDSIEAGISSFAKALLKEMKKAGAIAP